MEVCSCDSQEVVVSCRVKCEGAWSEVWLGGVWCVRVHECGFVMECRTANPSPSVAVTGTPGHTALLSGHSM